MVCGGLVDVASVVARPFHAIAFVRCQSPCWQSQVQGSGRKTRRRTLHNMQSCRSPRFFVSRIHLSHTLLCVSHLPHVSRLEHRCGRGCPCLSSLLCFLPPSLPFSVLLFLLLLLFRSASANEGRQAERRTRGDMEARSSGLRGQRGDGAGMEKEGCVLFFVRFLYLFMFSSLLSHARTHTLTITHIDTHTSGGV